MKPIAYAACALSCVGLLLAPPAPAQNDEAAATAQRLAVSSGLSAQLRGLGVRIEGEIRQSAAQLDERFVSALVDSAKEAFRAEALEEDMTRRIARKLTVADMKSALSWLEADLGRRITRAEEADAAAFDAAGFQSYAESLKTRPVSAQRQKLIAELVAATGAANAIASTQEAMALGIAMGMDALQPRERRMGESALRDRIREVMPPEKMRAIAAEELPGLFAYTYREVSDADLGAYVAFLRTAGGRRYNDAVTAAFIEGLARAGVRVGELAALRGRQTKM